MLEKVARTIAGKTLEDAFEGDAESEWPRVAYLARAVIEAMREPTDAMRRAGAIYQADGQTRVTDAIGTWRAMIDAALDEQVAK